MNYSFGLLKPDCVERGIEKKVLEMIESIGLKIIVTKRVRLTKKEVDVIWAPCMKENFYDDLAAFSLSGDCIVFIVKGNNAITKLNNLVGHYDIVKAKNGTIRRRFGKSVMKNIIHSTGDEKTFWIEALLFFK